MCTRRTTDALEHVRIQGCPIKAIYLSTNRAALAGEAAGDAIRRVAQAGTGRGGSASAGQPER